MRKIFGDWPLPDLWDGLKALIWRIFAPSAYANLWRRYQSLRAAMDVRDEEYEIDITAADKRIAELEARIGDKRIAELERRDKALQSFLDGLAQ